MQIMELHLIDGPLGGGVIKNFTSTATYITFSLIQDAPRSTFVDIDAAFELDLDCPYPRIKNPPLNKVTYKVSESDGKYIGKHV